MVIIEKIELKKYFNITISNVKYRCRIEKDDTLYSVEINIVKHTKLFNFSYKKYIGTNYIIIKRIPNDITNEYKSEYMMSPKLAKYLCNETINEINNQTITKYVTNIK